MMSRHAVETRTHTRARARGPTKWECLVSEEDVQSPRNSFNYKSRRTRRPRVGASLECDVQSWRPSAPEESSRAKRNLRQLFLHPRAANEEPDKAVEPIFDLCPGHRAVASPAGPNDEADVCVMTHFLRNRLDNFEGTFAGTGKMRILSCPD